MRPNDIHGQLKKADLSDFKFVAESLEPNTASKEKTKRRR
jgi:hypothetical protein